ncbi:MAG: FHA domain-containing protein [Phycisphaerales bacterium]|nr:FHA domain-containing protein [Phycisphaerales bacterium]
MALTRRLLRLELDLPRLGRDAEDGLGPAVLLWPKSAADPPEVPDAIVVSMDGDQVRLRAPGARLAEAAAVGEWRFVRGARVRLSWGTNIQEAQTFDLAEPAHVVAGAPHIELDLKGVPQRYLALPTTPGTRITVGSRSANPDVQIEDLIARGVVCRITFDGKDYRLDSQDANALALLNGSEIFWPAVMREGDQVYLGDASLRFSTAAPAGMLEPIMPAASLNGDAAGGSDGTGPRRVAERVRPTRVKARQRSGGVLARIGNGVTLGQLAIVTVVAAVLAAFLVYMGWRLFGGRG